MRAKGPQKPRRHCDHGPCPARSLLALLALAPALLLSLPALAPAPLLALAPAGARLRDVRAAPEVLHQRQQRHHLPVVVDERAEDGVVAYVLNTPTSGRDDGVVYSFQSTA